MKKSLLGLLIALLTFLVGIFAAQIFRLVPKPVREPLFEKEIVEVPLFETAPINEPEDFEINKPEDSETGEYFQPQIIYAWYSLDYYKGMPEVAMINFYGTDMDDDGVKLKKMAFQTGIYTHLYKRDVDEGYAEGIETTVEGNKLKFKTKKLKGIEYRFEGRFFKNKMTGEYDEKLLRGTLQKFVKGKKTAEVSGDFAYGEPHCLH